MKIKTRCASVTALTAMAVTIAAGSAHAENFTRVDAPQSLTTDLAPGIHYTDNLSDGTAAINTPFGTVAMKAGQVDIRDAGGHTVFGTPLEDTVPAAEQPSALATEAAQVATQVAAQPVAGDLMSDLGQAVEAANPHMGAAMAVGTAVGSVIGIAVGCPFGVATGGTLMSLVSVGTLAVPAIVATCLIGAVAVGGIGAVVGGVAAAIPVGIAAGTQRFNQLQAQHAAEAQRTAGAPAPANS